jgi:N utilization substance protein B
MANKQQWKKRVDVFRYIYSDLINEHKPQRIKQKAFEDNLFDNDQMSIIEYYADHKQEIINSISKYLKQNWTFERLPVVDQAILLTAIAEHKALKIDIKIIIDQALVNAKYYGEANSIKYINAILDKILKNNNE